MDFDQLSDFYRGKTVLVTGHSGFKGSWLCFALLSMGAKVVGVSLPPKTPNDIFVLTDLRSEVEHHEFDIRNFESAYICHQAGRGLSPGGSGLGASKL